MKKFYTLFLICLPVALLLAQPTPGTGTSRLNSYTQRKALDAGSLVNNIPFTNIGPRIMSGRVVDLAVNPNNTTEFYVAFASGGLWYTHTNGQTFTPVFDHEAVMTIGAIAVRWTKPEAEIWIGTGEVNSSRSSYSGLGIYKSMNGGKSWTHSGLEESHHIGKIVLDPADPNTAWVGVLGHLYSSNKERGVYKTTDGGSTWKQTLFVDENTGCVNMELDPNNRQILYANMWYRTRRAWNFEESGSTSGIYKSTDGGTTWNLISGITNGLPAGPGFGRSGVSVFPGNSNILYGVIDNQNHRSEEPKKASDSALTAELLEKLDKETFLKLTDTRLNNYLVTKGFPERYTATTIKEMVRSGKITVRDIVSYTDDANTLLFRTPVIGAEIYKSMDGGQHWTKQNARYMNGLYNTYGYYFGQVVVSPKDENVVYTFGVPLIKSKDAGATWKTIDAENVHGDFHNLWVDPNNPQHMICGNDGGVNITYDDGAHWVKCNSIPVAQCYSVNIDHAENYNVYAGLQDNNVWAGPHNGDESVDWHQEGNYSFKPLIGGDGMQVQIDTRDNNTVYTGYQFGNYSRINKATGEEFRLNIEENIGEAKLRWNWNTPILISKHSQDIIYWGSNKLHRSLDKGNNWQTISGDLTNGKKEGDVTFGTLTTIDESKLDFGLLYTGSDDGKVYVTKDGGATWNEIGSRICTQLNVPQQLWVSRVIASSFSEARVYVTLNGYRNDHFKSYVFVSDDYGMNWKNISSNLPDEPVNVLREDIANEKLLFLGTDHGLYLSFDKGDSWMRWSKNLPDVAIHDLVIQPKAKQLVLGSHGRSIFIADLKLIEQLTPEIMAMDLKLMNNASQKLPRALGKVNYTVYADPQKPVMEIPYFAKHAGVVTLKILNTENQVIREMTDTAEQGINLLVFDYTIPKPQAGIKNPVPQPAEDGSYYILKGKYKFTVNQGSAKTESMIDLVEK